MAKTIKTYSMLERVEHADFDIHTEHDLTSVEKEHRHEYFQLQLHLAGRTEHRIGARMLTLEPGSLCFVLPYRIHRAGRTPGSKFFVINFETRFLRPALDVDPLDLEDVPLGRAPELAPFLFQEYMDFRLRGADLRLARSLCAEMALENSRRGFCSLELIHAHLFRLLATVCRKHEGKLLRLASEHAQIRSRRDALSRVLRYVREHVGTRINLTEAATAAHLSPNYLTHLLKKETGKTFVELVTARRMEKARELLSQTALRVTDIAEAVGFEDVAYFTRRFRQHFRAGPREYRNKASGAAE